MGRPDAMGPSVPVLLCFCGSVLLCCCASLGSPSRARVPLPHGTSLVACLHSRPRPLDLSGCLARQMWKEVSDDDEPPPPSTSSKTKRADGEKEDDSPPKKHKSDDKPKPKPPASKGGGGKAAAAGAKQQKSLMGFFGKK